MQYKLNKKYFVRKGTFEKVLKVNNFNCCDFLCKKASSL